MLESLCCGRGLTEYFLRPTTNTGLAIFGSFETVISFPKSTPEEIKVKLSEMIAQINADPEFRAKMENDGMAMLDVDYKGYNAFIDEMSKIYLEAAREANIIK